MVILDPPAFAKRKKDAPQAQAAYRKLNQLAMPLIDRDGLLVSCSCSYHMGADELVDRDPDRGAAHQPLRAGAGAGRPVARSPGPSGDSRNPLSQIFFLPRHAGITKLRPNDSSTPPSTKLRFEIGPFGSFGPLKVHWYGIMYLVAFAAGWLLARVRAKKPGSTWKPADVDDFMFFCMLGTILGGRLGYVFFYGLSFWAEDPWYPFKIMGRRHVVPWRSDRRDRRARDSHAGTGRARS